MIVILVLFQSKFCFFSEKSLILAKKLLHEEELFSVRRSKRSISKFKSATSFDSFIESQCEDGIEARDTGTVKGRGIFTTKKFYRNDYIVEYAGELLTQAEAKHRESIYGRNHQIGCYMYYFKYGEKVFCVDATEETNRLGSCLVQELFFNDCLSF